MFQKYIRDEQNFSLAIQKIQFPSFDPELALLAMKKDLLIYFKKVVSYNLHIWDFSSEDVMHSKTELALVLQQERDFSKTYLKKEYQEMKVVQEELLDFLAQLHQIEVPKTEDADQISSLYQVIIDIGDSSKYLKDVWDRVEDWQWSSSIDLQKDYESLRMMVLEFYTSVLQLLANLDNKQAFELVQELLEKIEIHDTRYLKMFKHKEGSDVDLANLIQVSRYFSMSCMALVKAIENVRLSIEDKKYLGEHIKELF